MCALSVENAKSFSLEKTAMSINLGENFLMKSVLPIECPKDLKDELLTVELAIDVHLKMDARERLMQKYAIMNSESSSLTIS